MPAARILDGKAVAQQVLEEVRQAVPQVTRRLGRPPGLAVVIVGDNPASRVYVANKVKTARELGLESQLVELPASVSQADLAATLDRLIADPALDGLLLQEPLPPHIDGGAMLLRMDPEKDVDGFHPVNVGRAWCGLEALTPCTPAGVIELLVRAGIETRGAHAVIVGRSNIVGKPMACLLSRKGPGGDATVTIAHSRTRDLPALCRTADILVAAIGQPEFVRGEWIKPGATVIDVGINRVDDPAAKRGYRLTGDVAYAEAAQVAGAITPVPGGVGPMTIALLMRNTLQAACQRAGLGDWRKQ